jgi:hypothetical protein
MENYSLLVSICNNVHFNNARNANLMEFPQKAQEVYEQAQLYIQHIQQQTCKKYDKYDKLKLVLLFHSLLCYFPSFPCRNINWKELNCVTFIFYDETQQVLVYFINETTTITFSCWFDEIRYTNFVYSDCRTELQISIQPMIFEYTSGYKINRQLVCHSFDDNPARTMLSTCEWQNMGKCHRENDNCASIQIIDDTITFLYWNHGELHRSFGLPAIIEYENDKVINKCYFYRNQPSRIPIFEQQELNQLAHFDEIGRIFYVCRFDHQLSLYFQIIFDTLLEMYFLTPILTKEIVVSILQCLFGDCSYRLLSKCYDLCSTFVAKSFGKC